MTDQISIFDGDKPLRIEKPIRLIELFARYGSQALALKYLGVQFEHYKISEWAVPSIKAYKYMHFGDDNTDYSAAMTKDDLVNYFCHHHISSDYSTPLSRNQLQRMGETKLRDIYNNAKSSNNLLSVCDISAKDLEIVENDKFTYLLTYSFPCQDLSLAGKGAGMEKGSGTRSGMLWEVERLLQEGARPQILLMENVPEVIGNKNISAFADWVSSLEKMGYTSKWKIMNATEYKVPQNRRRCFMVSWLGDYYYQFPPAQKLEIRLKDLLEDDVDEKYYLSQKTIEYFIKHTEEMQEKGNGFKFSATNGDCVGKAITTRAGSRMDDNFIDCLQVWQMYPKSGNPQDGSFTTDGSSHKHNNRVVEMGENLRIRKLTQKECWRLMGVKDEDFEKVATSISKSLLYHLAGDSIEVSCLMAIFGMMLDVDWKRKIDDLVEDICEVESTTDTRIYENGKIIKE